MALKDTKVKVAADGVEDVRRKVKYLLLTCADCLNSIETTVSKYGKASVKGEMPVADAAELETFYANFKALVLTHDPSLTIKNL